MHWFTIRTKALSQKKNILLTTSPFVPMLNFPTYYNYTVYNRTFFKNGSCYTIRPGTVSCWQKFLHFWMIIRDLFFEKWINRSNENKKNTAKVCHVYFWSNNSALFEHWNWKSTFKHRWMVCFRSKKGSKNLIFLHLFFKLCQTCSHYLMK